MTQVRLATPADEGRIVSTIVAAFDEDPAFRMFFGDGSDFGALAAHFAKAQAMRRAIACGKIPNRQSVLHRAGGPVIISRHITVPALAGVQPVRYAGTGNGPVPCILAEDEVRAGRGGPSAR